MHVTKNFLFAVVSAGLASVSGAAPAPAPAADAGPTANAVRSPGLHEVVPVGTPYEIKWDLTPYKDGTVSLTLLKGPASNAAPYMDIVSNTTNDGSYTWTPPNTIPDSNGDTGYGIMLVVDANGAYQYTTQFGISN
ncbi:gpi anchored serine-threonine rich protein [Diplodia corticola]|uniref:Gpi anchored serine-threonine rich protein n=1 Tax=Diplodia corticola TaxID=236234 RepID=A0A1J9RVN8_9PEZI|nr:gpi anchored serine-threonine rich protein [Diplodia corticola]OJD31908.1 gpi anchored serine-threonine rich protein [Diplodia corticola]